jgi:hypothetical protein
MQIIGITLMFDNINPDMIDNQTFKQIGQHTNLTKKFV